MDDYSARVGNGIVPNRQQTAVKISEDKDRWRIDASLGGIGLHLYVYKVECRYNAVQYNMILHGLLHWLSQSVSQFQPTKYIPYRASYGMYFVRIWEKIDGVKMTPYVWCSTLWWKHNLAYYWDVLVCRGTRLRGHRLVGVICDPTHIVSVSFPSLLVELSLHSGKITIHQTSTFICKIRQHLLRQEMKYLVSANATFTVFFQCNRQTLPFLFHET